MKETKRERHRSSSSHFHLPSQILLGILFLGAGVFFFLRKTNTMLQFIPEDFLASFLAIASIVGGAYLIIIKFHRPRIYV